MVFRLGSRYQRDETIFDYFGKIWLQQCVNFENVSVHIRVWMWYFYL